MNALIKNTLFIYCLCLISCSAQKTTSTNYSAISFKQITSQSHGGFNEEQYLVIKTIEDLKKVYTQINLFRKPGLPLPPVNFDNECIIALFMGQKKSGGYQIQIDSIKIKKDDSIEISVKETTPQGIASMAITQPFSIYLIQSKVEITFNKID